MHAKSGGSCGEPPDFLFIPAACRSRKEPPRSVGGGDRARNTGNRPRDAEDGATGRAQGAGRGARVRNTEDAGVGRRTQNAEHVDADADAGTGHGGTGTGARGAGRRTQNAERRTRATGRGQQNTGNGGTKCRRRGIGDGAQAPVHGPQRDCIHPPGLATTCRDRSQPGAIRRGPHPTCRAYESESRRCRRARRTCCCRAAPRPT